MDAGNLKGHIVIKRIANGGLSSTVELERDHFGQSS